MRIRRVPTSLFPPVKPPVKPPASAGARQSSRCSATKKTGRRRDPSTGLTGKRLAAAAHQVAMRIDATGQGVGPRELQEALVVAGVAIGGGDAYMVLYLALNSPSGYFERAGRGRYRWLPVDEA